MAKHERENSLRKRIVENMEALDIKELLVIWHKQDHKEWSDATFEIVHDILLKRLGTIPDPDPALVQEKEAEAEAEVADEDEVEGEDECFHDPTIIQRIAGLANAGANVSIILYGVMIATRLLSDLERIQDITPFAFSGVYSIVYGLAANVATGIWTYIMLKGVSQVLYIFMDIEHNTYLAAKNRIKAAAE